MLQRIVGIIGLFVFTTSLALAQQTPLCNKDNTNCILELLGPEPAIKPVVECGSEAQDVVYIVKSH